MVVDGGLGKVYLTNMKHTNRGTISVNDIQELYFSVECGFGVYERWVLFPNKTPLCDERDISVMGRGFLFCSMVLQTLVGFTELVVCPGSDLLAEGPCRDDTLVVPLKTQAERQGFPVIMQALTFCN
jgi:hypothetical protein